MEVQATGTTAYFHRWVFQSVLVLSAAKTDVGWRILVDSLHIFLVIISPTICKEHSKLIATAIISIFVLQERNSAPQDVYVWVEFLYHCLEDQHVSQEDRYLSVYFYVVVTDYH